MCTRGYEVNCVSHFYGDPLVKLLRTREGHYLASLSESWGIFTTVVGMHVRDTFYCYYFCIVVFNKCVLFWKASPERSTRTQQKEFQTSIVDSVMEHLLAAEVLLGKNSL